MALRITPTPPVQAAHTPDLLFLSANHLLSSASSRNTISSPQPSLALSMCLPQRPSSPVHQSLAIFSKATHSGELKSACQKLAYLLSIASSAHPYRSSIESFLDSTEGTLPMDLQTMAIRVARNWSDQLSRSAWAAPAAESNLQSPSDLHEARSELSSARQEAIANSEISTLLLANPHSGPLSTLHPQDTGRSLNKVMAALGKPSSTPRALADNAQDMMLASPFTRLQRRVDCNPYPRVGYHESKLFELSLSELRCLYSQFVASGLSTPPEPPTTTVDLSFPKGLVDLHTRVRRDKGKSPASGAHHQLNPLAIIQMHMDKSITPCIHCLSSTCMIIHTATLAFKCPIPFVAKRRPSPSLLPAVYPAKPGAQVLVASELTGYLLQGVVRQIPLDVPALEHPIFIVDRYRFAPSAAILSDLYNQQSIPLATLLSQKARAALVEVLAKGTLSPSALNETLNAHRTDSKHRMVVDYGPGLNDSIADWTFSYVHLSRFLSTVQPGCWVASFDIAAAFVLIPTHPEDQPLLAMRWSSSGSLTQDGRLLPGDSWIKVWQQRHLFGSKHLPALFSTLSAEMIGTLNRRVARYAPQLNKDRVLSLQDFIKFLAYMDDLFVFASTRLLCEKACEDLCNYTDSIGAKRNDKTRTPAQTGIPILGILVDTIEMSIALPLDKAYSSAFLCAVALEIIGAGLTPPDNFWDKLLGKLEHAKYATLGGAGRLARIRHARQSSLPDPVSNTSGVPLQNAPLLVESLQWWLHALADSPPSARLFTSSTVTSSAAQLATRSDASGSAGASIHLAKDIIIHCLWTKETASNPSIQMKELYPFILFLERYGHLMRGLSISFQTDNLPNVYGLNKQSMKDQVALEWLVYLSDLADFFHILLLPSWLPREANVESDITSKAESPDDVARIYPHLLRVL